MCNNWGTHEMRKFDNVNELVNTLKPDNPVYCIRPKSIKKSVEFFKKNFPGKILYAVKTNPNERVIKTIINSGIQNFDVASINEIKLVKKIDNKVKVYFMHTIKKRESIKEAYFKYNVKDFAIDTKEELLKILEATNNAKDLNLYVRIAISNEHAEIDLSRKFGALASEALGRCFVIMSAGFSVPRTLRISSSLESARSWIHRQLIFMCLIFTSKTFINQQLQYISQK